MYYKSYLLPLFLFGLCLIQIQDVHAQLTAKISYTTPGDSCKARRVELSATNSTGAITSYQWQFKNKTTGENLESGSGQTIRRSFLIPGLYEISLTVSDGTTSSTDKVEIPVHKLPEVNFSVDANEGCPPLNVKFEDNSTPGSGVISKWEWNYSDGTKDVFNELKAPNHTYSTTDNYSPTLILTNSFGCTNSKSIAEPIKVYNKITPAIWVEDNFNCEAPHTVTFNNHSPETENFNFKWDFGDENVVTNNNETLTHEYTAPGIYTIKLQAINETENCSTSVATSGNKNVYIGRPEAAITAPENVCVGASGALRSEKDATEISNQGKWLIEKDGVSNSYYGKSRNHTFATTGLWKVKYINYNTYSGCSSDTAEAEVNVLPTPTASLTVDIPNGCQRPHEVTFTNTSQNASSYKWNFGDGTSQTTTSSDPVTHTYTDFGISQFV